MVMRCPIPFRKARGPSSENSKYEVLTIEVYLDRPNFICILVLMTSKGVTVALATAPANIPLITNEKLLFLPSASADIYLS